MLTGSDDQTARLWDAQTAQELRKIDHRAVMAWERLMREEEKKEAYEEKEK